jgi:sporulation-control protein spo0M
MTEPVALAVPDRAVAPGDELRAVVTVAGADARDVRAELYYVNTYLRPAPDPAGTNQSTSTLETALDLASELSSGPEEEATADVVVQSVSVSTTPESAAGDHELLFTLPADAPPTVADAVEWKVRAMVDRPTGPHDEAVADVGVASTPEGIVADIEPGTHWDDQFEVIVPGGQAVRAGDTLAGTLVITPHKGVKFTDLRVELKGEREDHNKIKHNFVAAKADVAGATQIEAGQRHEVPFTLAVPADALPTFAADNNILTHTLVVTAARRMRTDLQAVMRVRVASPAA